MVKSIMKKASCGALAGRNAQTQILKGFAQRPESHIRAQNWVVVVVVVVLL